MMETQPSYRNKYLYEQLISYIGNKRKLIPFIEQVLLERWGERPEGLTFLDLFAGSGVVSRLARSMGYRVIANDWESYAAQINRCYLQHSPDDLDRLFKPWGGAENLWKELNNLSDPEPSDEYIARYYSPRSMDPFQVEIGKERLFYTRRNGLILDRIRNEVDLLFPSQDKSAENQSRRSLVLGPLLYQASKHTNTSGVFKAYHKGFGGYGKDALSRILQDIELPLPCLWEDYQEHQVFQKDASLLAEELDPVDIAYIDPPYNQHQYGSNYHMLNTLVQWDQIPEPLELNDRGELKRKAAIRHDWQKTSSPYCKKNQAGEAFAALLENVKARQIIISYSTDGIIPIEEMRKICEEKGKLSLLCNPYAVYKGGRQSNLRKHRNIEFLWILESGEKNTSNSRRDNQKQLLLRELQMLTDSIIHAEKLAGYKKHEEGIQFTFGDKKVYLYLQRGYLLSGMEGTENLSVEELKVLKESIVLSLFRNTVEELDFLFGLFKEAGERNKKKIISDILRMIRKLAHPKTRKDFLSFYQKYLLLEKGDSLLEPYQSKIREIGRVAQLRMKDLNLPGAHLN